MLPLCIDVPMTSPPLRVCANSSCGKISRIAFAWKEERIVTVQIRPSISRESHAEALADRVARSRGPVQVLTRVQDAARIRGRGIRELASQVHPAKRRVQTHACQAAGVHAS